MFSFHFFPFPYCVINVIVRVKDVEKLKRSTSAPRGTPLSHRIRLVSSPAFNSVTL